MKMKNVFKMLFLISGLVLMMVGQSQANPIPIVVDFIETATGVDAYIDNVLVGSTSEESIEVTISEFDYPAAFKFYQDILEPDGMTLSDRILWDFKGIGGGTIITFGSDPQFPDITGATNLNFDIIEDGTLQAAFGPWPSAGGGAYLLYTNFKSDIEQAAPEPATILLFATGLVGLVGLRRKEFFEKR
ncbi:MAG: PEP-CTERM sorting domain-containing protein [Deltaproteobacteria bacterium]